jgi:hypothetical protein
MFLGSNKLKPFLSVAAVCLVVGVVTYPAGWDATDVKRTCGTSAGRYELGDCGLRWACLLAVIGCLDAIILAALAFILATRHVRLQAEPGFTANGSLYKGVYGALRPLGDKGGGGSYWSHRGSPLLHSLQIKSTVISFWYPCYLQ